MFKLIKAIMPRSDNFFDLFESQALKAQEAAKLLRGIVEGGPETADLCARLSSKEEEADRVSYEVLQSIRRSFITPFDRSDIKALSTTLDDAIDQMNKTGKSVMLYEVTTFDPNMRAMADRIILLSDILVEALPLMRNIGARRVADRQPVAFHHVLARLRHVQKQVDDVILQQVHFVDVQIAPVRPRQKPRLERLFAFRDRPLDVQRADHAVFADAKRQVHHRRRLAHHGGRGQRHPVGAVVRPGRVHRTALDRLDLGQQRRQRAHRRRLAGAAVAKDQHAADARIDRGQRQGQLHVVLADDGSERKHRPGPGAIGARDDPCDGLGHAACLSVTARASGSPPSHSPCEPRMRNRA